MTGSTAPPGRTPPDGPPAGPHAFFPLATLCVPKQAVCRFTKKHCHSALLGPGSTLLPRVSSVSKARGSICWIAGKGGLFAKSPPFPRAPFPLQKLLPGRMTGSTAPPGRTPPDGPPAGPHELFRWKRFVLQHKRPVVSRKNAVIPPSRSLAFLVCRRGTGGRGTPCAEMLPVILPARFFAGWVGGAGGRKGAFLQKKRPSFPPHTAPPGAERFPQAGEGGQKRFEMYADSAKLTRLWPKTHQP